MWAVPLELREANAYVEMNHRHHAPVHRDKYRIGCADENGLHGVIQIGRPVSRMLDDGMTLEVVRCCTDGTRNVCSFLYARAARVARELGYRRMITYILGTESGNSLSAWDGIKRRRISAVESGTARAGRGICGRRRIKVD